MNININARTTPIPQQWRDETLLHTMRELLGLVGAKYGCGVGICGACTVLLDGEAVRSWTLKVADVGARVVTTVEGLANGAQLHPVQQAWLDAQVPQCDYCQSGQIMSTVALLRRLPNPDDKAIDAALDCNLCRCRTQSRIRSAVKLAAGRIGNPTA